MKGKNIELMLENYHAAIRQRRNEALAARLSRPCSTEEMLERYRSGRMGFYAVKGQSLQKSVYIV